MLLSTVLVGSLIGVAACSSGGSKSEQSGDPAAGGDCNEVTVASWAAAADALEEAAGVFMENNEGKTVNIQRVGHDYANIIPALTAGSGAPDIMHVEQRDFQTFQRQFEGQFEDLTEFLAPHQAEFAEVAWAAGGDGEKMYGVPWDLGPGAVWYRTDFYQQAGIDASKIETWDDFIAAGKQLQDAVDGVHMVAFDTTGSDPNPSTWMLLMSELGGRYTDSEGRIDFANEPNIEAMEMVKRLVEEGIVQDAGDWSALVQTVASGQTASVILPVWFAGTIEDQAPDQKGVWSVMPLPAFEQGGNTNANLGGGVLAISSGSKCKQLAQDFVEFALLTNEGQEIQLSHGLFPSWQPFYETEEFKAADTGFFAVNIPETFASLAQEIPELEFGPYYMDFHAELTNAYGKVMAANEAADKAFQEAEKRAATATGLEITAR